MTLDPITFDASNNLGGVVTFWVADADSISSFPSPAGLIIPGNITFGSGGWRKIVCTLYTANFTTQFSSNEQGMLATPQIQAIIPSDAPSIVSQLRDLSGKKLLVLTKTPSGLYQVIGRTDKWMTLSYSSERQKSIIERAQTSFTLTGILPSPPLSYSGTITETGTPIEADVISNYGGAIKLWVADAETVYTYPKSSGTMSDDITFIEPGGWLAISYTLYSHSFGQQHQTRPFALESANIEVEIPTDIADILFNAMKLTLRKIMAMIQIPSGERYVIGSPDKWLNAQNSQLRPSVVNNGATIGLQIVGNTMIPAVLYTGAIILGEDMNWAVCRKWQNINTGSNDCFLRPVEKLYKILELRQLTGDKLTPYLYETLEDAGQEGLTGCLAYTISGINRWLERNLWMVDEKVLVFKTQENGSGSAYFEYLAEPTMNVGCGTEIVLRKLYSINFNNEVVANSFAISGKFLSMYLITVFDQLDVDNIYYEYSLTDTWGSPLISTNNICEFSAYMANKNTGYIRIRTTQTLFVEGGVLININYEGAESSTSAISVIMPANRIDQDLVLYCENFQFLTATSSQAGDVITFGVRNDIYSAADWTDFSYTTLAAINAVLNTTSLKALALYITEGTANTGANAKTINITGQFTDPKARGYISLLDRQNNKQFRTSLNNNSKVYDGTLDYDIVSGWTNIAFNLPYSLVVGFYFETPTIFASYMTNLNGGQNGVFPNCTMLINRGYGGQLFWNINLININGSQDNYFEFTGVKQGYNIIVASFTGVYSSGQCTVWLNGKKVNVTFVKVGTVTSNNSGKNVLTIGEHTTAVGGKAKGKIRKTQMFNRVFTDTEARQIHLNGDANSIISDDDFLLDIDFNQTGTNELIITKGTYVAGIILGIANNGHGKPRFTVNGTTQKSPVNGATVIVEGTINYNTGTAGAVIARISDTQFDIITQVYVSDQIGTYRVRVAATGGAAYNTFMT